jgi:arsenite methyltransferase
MCASTTNNLSKQAPPGEGMKQGEVETTEAPGKFGKAGYGIDQPGAVIQLVAAALLTIITGFAVAFTVFRQDVALGELFLFGMPIGGFLILAVAASLYWRSKLGKPREVERLMKEIPWGGSEVTIDIGCGRGLMMIDAAKRFDEGLSVGVDLWKSRDLSGNDPRSIWTNAKKEEVLDRVAPIKADARHLPIADNSVDAAISSMTIHLLGGRTVHKDVIGEMVRITKPGGRLAIIDAGRGGEYSDLLQDLGVVDLRVSRLRFRSFPPLHSVTGRKPFTG